MTEEALIKQRERRKKDGNAVTKRYEKTKKGFLVRLYRNMQSRVLGVQKIKYHLYKGKELLDRDSFYDWALADDTFNTLFALYESSGFSRKEAPSPDRIDSSKGYILENMEWVTMSENSRRGSIARHKQNL